MKIFRAFGALLPLLELLNREKYHKKAKNADFKINQLGHFDVAKTSVMYSDLWIKNTKPIRAELTELWQFCCQTQIELYCLVWQGHVKKTITSTDNVSKTSSIERLPW